MRLDFLEGDKEMAYIQWVSYKVIVVKYHNSKGKLHKFQEESYVEKIIWTIKRAWKCEVSSKMG